MVARSPKWIVNPEYKVIIIKQNQITWVCATENRVKEICWSNLRRQNCWSWIW